MESYGPPTYENEVWRMETLFLFSGAGAVPNELSDMPVVNDWRYLKYGTINASDSFQRRSGGPR